MNTREAIKFVLIRSLGNFLFLMSLYGVVMTFGPALYYEAQYRIMQVRGITFKVSSMKHEVSSIQNTKYEIPNTETLDFASILAGSKEQILVPEDTTFSIVIPKIGASARVYPNIDASNPDEFLPVLKHGVAHAKGTVFPGMPGNTYLFAHSADNWWDVGRYNAVFYLLKNLQKGDEVTVFFEDVRYEYVVSETLIAEPDDVTLLKAGRETPQLVLQTCWPPGTTLKRQFVVATPKTSI